MSMSLNKPDRHEEVMDRKSVAQLMGICLTTLDRLDIPRYKIRRRVLYRRSDIFQYLESKIEIKEKEEK